MSEVWKKVPGLAEKYEVSSLGRVRILDWSYEVVFFGKVVIRRVPGRLCELRGLSPKGYARVNLDGRIHAVHRLVATAFIPNPLNLPQVNHKDGVKVHNGVDNLEWVTNQQNRDHAVATGLQARGPRPHLRKYGEVEVAAIRVLLAGGASLREVGRQFDTSHGAISKALSLTPAEQK